jgi:hypothetical protein
VKKIDLYAIKSLGDTIIHGGDYGKLYISKDLKMVVLVLGHADDLTGCEMLLDLLEEIDMTYAIMYESNPKNLDEYVLLSKGLVLDDYDQFDPVDDFGNEIVAVPSLLTLDEYSRYLQLMETIE